MQSLMITSNINDSHKQMPEDCLDLPRKCLYSVQMRENMDFIFIQVFSLICTEYRDLLSKSP